MESIRGGVGTDGKSSCDLGSIGTRVPRYMSRGYLGFSISYSEAI